MPTLDETKGDKSPEAVPPAASQTPDGVTDTPDTDSHTPALPDPQSSGGKTDQQAPNSQEPKSMAEAIEAAMQAGKDKPLDQIDGEAVPADGEKPGEKAAGSEATVEDGTEGKDKSAAPGEEDDDDPTEEELATYRAGTRNRIKKLLNQRNTAREEAVSYRDDANSFRQIREYMSVNQLEDREVAELFELGAHLKSGDPKRLSAFVQRVGPLMQRVAEMIGQTVPSDLRPQVEQGEMSEEAAKALARERTARVAAEQRVARVNQDMQAHAQSQQVQAVSQSVAAWEAKVRATDPDFDKKAQAMQRIAHGIVAQRGPAKTAEEAQAYAQEAYDTVTSLMRQAAPAPKPTRPAASAQPVAARTGLSPAPTSLADAIRIGLEQGARR